MKKCKHDLVMNGLAWGVEPDPALLALMRSVELYPVLDCIRPLMHIVLFHSHSHLKLASFPFPEKLAEMPHHSQEGIQI